MKNVNLVVSVFILFLAVACSKDQRVTNKLEGEWEVERYVDSGNVYEFDDATYDFKDCKVKKDDCEGSFSGSETYSYVDFNGDLITETDYFSYDFEYSVDGKEDEMELILDYGDGDVYLYDVDFELDKDDLTLEYLDEYDDPIQIDLKRK